MGKKPLHAYTAHILIPMTFLAVGSVLVARSMLSGKNAEDSAHIDSAYSASPNSQPQTLPQTQPSFGGAQTDGQVPDKKTTSLPEQKTSTWPLAPVTPPTRKQSPTSQKTTSAANEAPEPIDETIPPPEFSEVRSIMEPSLESIDWLYTLRADADYDGIAASQSRLHTQMQSALTAIADGTAPASAVVNSLCATDAELALLRSKLAPFSDFSQLSADRNNDTVLNDIQSTVNQVKQIWTDSQGSPITCGL